MAYDAARGQVVLFGGYGNISEYGDTWVWDGTNWTQKSPAISPSLRESHAMAYDAARGQVVLFGGVGSHVDNETWVWPSDPTGGISVTTNLSAASFNISGPVNYSGNGLSFSQVNAPAGTYTINYGSVVGYRPPLSETKTLTNDGSVSFSGTYSNLVGTISISVQPSTATYSVTGPAGFSGFGSAIHKAMPAGQYTVAYSPLVGYLKPPPETKSLSPGGSILFSGTYQLAPGTGSLTIQVSPPTASYRVVGPSSFSGTGNIGPNNTNKYSGLPVGTYTITFLPLIGPAFITPPPKTVLLQANDSPSVIGKYLSSASPPTLKLSACTTPICAAQKITARGPGFVIADVTLSNLTGAWYQLNVQSESTTGSPVRLDAANKLPYAFLISPYKALTFPGIRFETGQYLAINAEKYSVAATSILAIDVILRGLFGVEINGTWEGYLDLQSAVMVEILSSDEVTAPAVAFFVCRDPLCRLEQLADFVFKASNDAKTWNAIKSLISDSKVFGANAARQAEAVRRWTSLGSQSVSTFLSIFNAIGNVQKMSDVWIASLLAPNFGNIRIEAVQ